ncbi:hypothetical protein [Mesorhizobium australicum]|jgi:hypothetical protein|uniref:Transposase n=1 Tax=Mesorhizobium australicum TaxID=536018 RepID=A0A1X7MRZ4_9HYPH|nr:hypothetical protein [Mesorhizobium australicum]SMH26816.1 hypothetical protein SAMN02982922_0463 [Mesorhizobium australicum]
MQGKALSEPNTMTPVYVGIDVCKAWLDVHVGAGGVEFRIANNRPVRFLQKIAHEWLFCRRALHLINALTQLGTRK